MASCFGQSSVMGMNSGSPYTVALDEIGEPAAPPRATEHELEARAEGVLERVMALPLEYREAIYLHYYEGYTLREIARLLGVTVPTVKMRLKRGRDALRNTWEESL